MSGGDPQAVDYYIRFEDDAAVFHFDDGIRLNVDRMRLPNLYMKQPKERMLRYGTELRKNLDLETRIRVFGLDWLRNYHHELGQQQAYVHRYRK